jgi:hypothetical protein
MSEIKFKYAYVDNIINDIISINDVTNENRNQHKFRCIGCNQELIPRAINSKYKKPHFYHKEIVNCSGETYLHKLAKHIIKEKFEKNPVFLIKYYVSKKCNNNECKFRTVYCQDNYQDYIVDLKKYYDTCTEEAPINGFIADLLLTNSKNPSLKPTLIEIYVSHPCDDNKKNAGFPIMELKINNEEDILNLHQNDVICEQLYAPKGDYNAKFFSFKKEFSIPFQIKLQRYIYIPKQGPNGYLTTINCNKAQYKLRVGSLIELNIINLHNDDTPCTMWFILEWLSEHKGWQRCNLCKYYYATSNENDAKCRLSKKYDTPIYPAMNEAEKCKYYRKKENWSDDYSYFKQHYFIEEVSSSTLPIKPEYKVIVAVSHTFNNYKLFKDKILYYLSEKIKTHTIIIITGVSVATQKLTDKLLNEIDFIEEPHDAVWNKYGQNTVCLSNLEMTTDADALIAFWDGISSGIKDLIKQAKSNNIKLKVIEYSS